MQSISGSPSIMLNLIQCIAIIILCTVILHMYLLMLVIRWTNALNVSSFPV